MEDSDETSLPNLEVGFSGTTEDIPQQTVSVAVSNTTLKPMPTHVQTGDRSASPRRREPISVGGVSASSARRQLLALQDRKSRSFDSSFEDRDRYAMPTTGNPSYQHRQAAPTTTAAALRFRSPALDGGGGGGGGDAGCSDGRQTAGNIGWAVVAEDGRQRRESYMASHDEPQSPSGTRDRRRRLRQTQRKSRSLDVYEPCTEDGRKFSVGLTAGELCIRVPTQTIRCEVGDDLFQRQQQQLQQQQQHQQLYVGQVGQIRHFSNPTSVPPITAVLHLVGHQ